MQTNVDDISFGLVGQKLVWVNFATKLVSHINVDELSQKEATWVNATCNCFSVDEFLSNLSSEDYRQKGI